MNKLLNNQKGYNLVIVIMVATVFLVVGLSVITMSLKSSLRTSIRETDIQATAQARQMMDEIIAELKNNVSVDQSTKKDLTKYFLNLKKENGEVPYTFDTSLQNIIDDKLYGKFDQNHVKSIQSLDIKNVTNDFAINTKKAFTRIYDITLIVKDKKGENQSLIQRTLKRRVILSPTPSFLQYAVGAFNSSTDSGLILRGSPTILGNVFANSMTIEQKARFYKRGTPLTNLNDYEKISTPFPSIRGDIYTTKTDLLNQMIPESFYNKKVPNLKNHSIFVDMNLKTTRLERTAQLMNEQGMGSTSSSDNMTQINNYINSKFSKQTFSSVNDLLSLLKLPIGTVSSKISNLAAVALNKSDLLIQDTNVQINNISSVTLDTLQVKGNLTLNSKDTLNIKGGLFVDGDITINNYNNLNIGRIISTGSINIVNGQGKLVIENNIITKGNLKVDAFSPVSMISESLIGGNLSLNPTNTTISVLNNMIVNGDFSITGNDDTMGLENDNTIFDSVIYTGGKSTVTNVNIKGADNNTKQLVLLSEGDLQLFRINEFSNLSNPTEPVSEKSLGNNFELSNITPLKGYFYTDNNADLYGVGSFFYINGGLFARNNLTISAIRGNVRDENDLITFSKTDATQPSEQQGKYSRFNVKYDKSVLLNRIDALPIVNSLQVIPDDITIK